MQLGQKEWEEIVITTTTTTITTNADQLKSLCMQLFRFIGLSASLSNQHVILPFFCRSGNLTFESACDIILMNMFCVFVYLCLIIVLNKSFFHMYLV